MKITYQASEDDFIRAGMLMLRKKSPFVRYMPWLGGAILLCIFGNFAINAASRNAMLQPNEMGKVLLGILCPALMVALPWLSKRNLRRQFQNSPIVAERRTLQADFTGLHFRSPSASGDIAWTTYTGFFEDSSNFLLIQQGKLLFVPIPKRDLSAAQIEEVRSTFGRVRKRHCCRSLP